MDLLMMYKYAYWGAISHLEVLEKLYNMFYIDNLNMRII